MMIKNSLMDQAVRKLVEKHKDIEVLTPLVDSELKNMLEQIKRQYESQGKKFDEVKLDPRQFVEANVEEATSCARGFLARQCGIQEGERPGVRCRCRGA